MRSIICVISLFYPSCGERQVPTLTYVMSATRSKSFHGGRFASRQPLLAVALIANTERNSLVTRIWRCTAVDSTHPARNGNPGALYHLWLVATHCGKYCQYL